MCAWISLGHALFDYVGAVGTLIVYVLEKKPATFIFSFSVTRPATLDLQGQ